MQTEEIIEQAVEYILTQDIDEIKKCTSAVVARQIGMDDQHLSQLFEGNFGLTLDDFIVREKIYRAYFLIRKEFDVSMEQLSQELGFVIVGEFERAFETCFSITPLQYRDVMARKHRKRAS